MNIYRSSLKQKIGVGEKLVADGGYGDDSCILKNSLAGITKRYHAAIRARHETVNKRLKDFKILKHVYRHSLSKHATCFFAVANITQIALEMESPLFRIYL